MSQARLASLPPGERVAAALRARYPTWFRAAARYDVEIPDGWAELVDRMCDDVAAALGPRAGEWRILGLKPKLGELRIYSRWRGERWPAPKTARPDPALDAARAAAGLVIEAAVDAARGTCDACGQPGQIEVGELGWISVRCAQHQGAAP